MEEPLFKKEIHTSSLEEQIDVFKEDRRLERMRGMIARSGRIMNFYGDDALSFLKESKCISMKDFAFKGKVGSGLYNESVFEYWGMVIKHLRWNNNIVGKEIYIEDNIDRLFVIKRSNYCLCGVFAFYFGSNHNKILLPMSLGYFGVSLPIYNQEDASPTGEFVCPETDSVHDVYNAVKDCETLFDVWNILKGKCLLATSIKRFITATYYMDGSSRVVSTKENYLNCFTFINRNPNIIQSPKLCYREFRIVSNENGKWGIYNDEKEKLIVDFFFDKIEWCRYDITKEAKYVFFYKNGKMAMWSTKELERLVQ